MTSSGMSGARVAWLVIAVGAAAIGVTSCIQNSPPGESSITAPYGGLANDPVEHIALDAERALMEAREAAGRGADGIGRAIEDGLITAKIVSTLLGEPGLPSLAIYVSTHHGVVTLNGVIDTPDSRTRAAQLALDVTGVRSVRNYLLVTEGSRAQP
jgi:hypothetical protein